jgi:putative transcriptional regulator
MANFKFIVKKVRNLLNFSQEKFAHELNVSFSTINRWENGKSLPSHMAVTLFFDYCRKKKINIEDL